MNSADAKRILETALICAQQPLPVRELRVLFADQLGADSVKNLLQELQDEWTPRGVELVQVASGWRFQSRPEMREYLALAHRPWRGPAEREVEAPIGRDARNRLRMAVVDLARQPGKPAQTRIELLGNAEPGCLLRCLLRTGRTHQIRVHLAHLGHPLVADALYGGAPAAGMARQALHARRLAFEHPITGQALDFQAPLPADLAAALAAWRLQSPR